MGEVIANCTEPRPAFRIRRECHCYRSLSSRSRIDGRAHALAVSCNRNRKSTGGNDPREPRRARLPDPGGRGTDHCNLINCDSCRPGANCSIIIHQQVVTSRRCTRLALVYSRCAQPCCSLCTYRYALFSSSPVTQYNVLIRIDIFKSKECCKLIFYASSKSVHNTFLMSFLFNYQFLALLIFIGFYAIVRATEFFLLNNIQILS